MRFVKFLSLYSSCQRNSNLGTFKMSGVYQFFSNDNQNYYPLLTKIIHALQVLVPYIIHIFFYCYPEVGKQKQSIFNEIICTYTRRFKSQSSQINLKNGTCSKLRGLAFVYRKG